MEGTIKSLPEGKEFGFIAIEGEEKDLFFHKNGVTGVSFEDLKVGDKVSFEKTESDKGDGRMNATGVTRV
ncbi:MAG: cold shock domain-containing protein [Candidatus Paceibacterota bacterium]|jgi:CspA family cold shock protein